MRPIVQTIVIQQKKKNQGHSFNVTLLSISQREDHGGWGDTLHLRSSVNKWKGAGGAQGCGCARRSCLCVSMVQVCGCARLSCLCVQQFHSMYNGLDSQIFRPILDGGGSKFGLKQS